jgi:hypothetical protein
MGEKDQTIAHLSLKNERANDLLERRSNEIE